MPIYYNPGSCFTKISHYHSSQSAIGIKACTQGDYWSAAEGSIVPAAADGIVYIAEKSNTINNNYGYYVVLEHTKKEKLNGKEIKVYTIYAHLNPTFLVKGHQKVTRGQALGYVGNSGGTGNVKDAKGLYFHFEIRDANYWIAPGKTWRDIDVVDPATFDLAQLMGIDETDQNTYSSPSCKADTSTADSNPEEENAPAIEGISTPTACTEDQFIVQIIGKNHPTEQRVILLDNDGKTITPDSKDTIEKTDQTLLSTLHQWDWCNIPTTGAKAYLEIQTNNQPIRLHISNEIKLTEKQTDKQDNQIVPIVPLTPLRSANSIKGLFNKQILQSGIDIFDPVHVRTGWVYIFVEGRLWRELAIKQDNKGMTYHDVPLYKNPEDTAEKITQDRREPTGKGLREIWIPACWNKADRNDVELMYSEVQLSAARINYLTKQSQCREQRTVKPALATSKKQTDQLTSKIGKSISSSFDMPTDNAYLVSGISGIRRALKARTELLKRSFPITLVEGHNARNIITEHMLDYPAQYLQQGSSHLQQALDEGRQLVKNNEQGKALITIQNSARQNRYPISIAAVATALEEQLQPKRKTSPTKNATASEQKAQEILTKYVKASLQDQLAIWNTTEPKNNILANAQQREIIGVLLEDYTYRYRQLQTQLQTAQETANLVCELSTYNKHYNSAIVVENVIRRETIDGEKNPINQYFTNYKDKINTKAIDIALSSALRQYTKACYTYALTKLDEQFTNPCSDLAIDDLCSLNGIDYIGAHRFIANLLTALAEPFFDPAVLDQNITYQTALNNVVKATTDKTQKIFKRIWSPQTTESLANNYIAPQTVEPNNGDGLCRPTVLRQFSEKDTNSISISDIQLIETGRALDINTIVGSSVTAGKAIGSTITSLLTDMASAAVRAQDQLNTLLIEQEKLSNNMADLNNQTAHKQADINKTQANQKTVSDQIDKQIEELHSTNEQITKNKQHQENSTQEIKTGEELKTEVDKTTNQTRKEAGKTLTEMRNTASDLTWQAQTARQKLVQRGRLAVMQIYRYAGDQLRQTHVGFFELVLRRRGNVDQKDYYILFEQAVDNAQLEAVRVNGTIDSNGHLQATTNIDTAQAARMEHIKADDRFWMLPYESSIAKELKRYYDLERQLFLAGEEGTSAYADAVARIGQLQKLSAEIQTLIDQQKTELQNLQQREKALNQQKLELESKLNNSGEKSIELQEQHKQISNELDELNKQKADLSHEIEANQKAVNDQAKVSASSTKAATRMPKVPAIIFLLESYNLFREWNSYDQTVSQKGLLRSNITIAGAGLDLYIAADSLLERIRNYRSQQVLAYYASSHEWLTQVVKKLTRGLVTKIPAFLTLRSGLQMISGGIFAYLSYRDWQDATRVGSKAATGYLMMTVGSLISMIPGGAPIALGISPIGWIALLLIVGGALYVLFFNQNDIEKWLANGPFGTVNGIPLLKDEQEAYYRLLSLLTNQQIKVALNPPEQAEAKEHIKTLLTQGKEIPPGLTLYANSNIKISLYNAVISMVNPLNVVKHDPFFKVLQDRFKYIWGARPVDSHWLNYETGTIVGDINYNCKTENTQGADYFFRMELTPLPEKSYNEQQRPRIAVRTQVKLVTNDDKKVYFPIALEDKTPITELSKKVSTTPTFTDKDKDYWYLDDHAFRSTFVYYSK